MPMTLFWQQGPLQATGKPPSGHRLDFGSGTTCLHAYRAVVLLSVDIFLGYSYVVFHTFTLNVTFDNAIFDPGMRKKHTPNASAQSRQLAARSSAQPGQLLAWTRKSGNWVARRQVGPPWAWRSQPAGLVSPCTGIPEKQTIFGIMANTTPSKGCQYTSIFRYSEKRALFGIFQNVPVPEGYQNTSIFMCSENGRFSELFRRCQYQRAANILPYSGIPKNRRFSELFIRCQYQRAANIRPYSGIPKNGRFSE